MKQEYSVFSGDEVIGKVFVQQQGLYYLICCRCSLTGDVKHKLIASCGKNTVDLGLCVPYSDGFGMDTRIPMKQLGEGELGFRLQPRHSKPAGEFIPVSPEEPFGYIQKLQQAHLAQQDGLVGIVVNGDQNSSDNPTGQWSEPSTSE